MEKLSLNFILIAALGGLVNCGGGQGSKKESNLKSLPYCEQIVTVYQFFPTGRGNCLKADPMAPNKIKSDPCGNDYSTMWLKLSGGRNYKNIRYPEIIKSQSILGYIAGPYSLSRAEAAKHGALGTYAKNRCWN